MQTFLPYTDFKQSARCLDYKRLGKQRLEARTILNILEGRGKIGKNGKYFKKGKIFIHNIGIIWKKNTRNNQRLNFYFCF